MRDSPPRNDKYFRGAETDVSTDYEGGTRNTMNGSMRFDGTDNYDNMRMSTMSTQTPFKNKLTSRGGPGNRNSQPQ